MKRILLTESISKNPKSFYNRAKHLYKKEIAIMEVVRPEKINIGRIELLDIKIRSFAIEITFFNVEDNIDFKLSFTDEDGQINKDDLAELYWILFSNPEFQHLTGIYYNGILTAIEIEEDNLSKRYITWDFLGDLVVNCFIGINHGRKHKDDE